MIEIDIPMKSEPQLPVDKPSPQEPQPVDQPAPLQPPTRLETHKAHADTHPERTQPRTADDASTRNARALEHTIAVTFQGANGAAVKLFQDDAAAETRSANIFGGTGDSEPGGPGNAALVIQGSGTAGRSAERIVARRTDLGPRDPDVIRTKPPVKVDRPIPFKPLEGPDDTSGLKEQIARKIAGRAQSVKACYEAALRDNPDASGKIRVNFTVGTGGTVTDVQVSGAQGGLADCIEAKFRAIRGLPLLPEARAFNQTFLLQRD